MKTATATTKETTFISPREMAVRRGNTLMYVYQQLWTGRVPGAQKVGKTWRIPVAAVAGKEAESGSLK